MSEKKILVIDDSATIRRLVDTELGAAGFRVFLAPNAEDGIEMAKEKSPDMILLDHQLPGTTGFDVASQLVACEQTRLIPVVISSTLRKKAYAEYVDLANVVDMLPKPYTADLLKTTVNNALETAAMIVQSQSEGSAVPEVIDELADGDLAGSFNSFSVREVIDFLNNCNKQGCLEIETAQARVSVYLESGRIQAACVSGMDPEVVSSRLPLALADLAPMVKFTIGGRNCSELDGLVELLNNKVLDARLLRQLLRYQAAILIQHCMDSDKKNFRFETGRTAPTLFTKLPLEISLLALLVEANTLDGANVPTTEPGCRFVRNNVRGQNLDRAGLSSAHMQVMNLVASPTTLENLCQQTGLSQQEMSGVLRGFELAELIKRESQSGHVVLVVTDNASHAQHFNTCFSDTNNEFSGKVVRDLLAIKLFCRRNSVNQLVIDLDRSDASEFMAKIKSDLQAQLNSTTFIGLGESETCNEFLDYVSPAPQEASEVLDLLSASSPSSPQTAECV